LGTLVATLGAGLAALHPGLLAYALKLHPLGMDVLLLALMVLWIGRLGARRRDGLMAGLAMGLNLMSRPTFFMAGLIALALRWQTIRRHMAPALIAVTVSVAVAAPWVGRNWIRLSGPVFISTSLEDVWKGNNPAAIGSSYLASGQDMFTIMPTELRTRLRAASELELNDVYGAEVLAFVRDRPDQFAGLVAQKFVYFWCFSPGLFYPAQWLTTYQVYDAIVLAFAVLGSVWIARVGSPEARRLLVLLITISLTISALHALAYVEGRHRWGVEPLLLLLTAQGLVAAATHLRVRARASET
jgi:hypothetical protein